MTYGEPGSLPDRLSGIGWTCHTCGLESRSWAAAERHARAEKHGRIVVHIEPRRVGR